MGKGTMHRLIRMLLLVLLAGTLAACGGDDDSDNTGAQDRLPESVTADFEGGTLTVRYPEGWVNTVEDGDNDSEPGLFFFPYLGLATNQTLLDSPSSALPGLLQAGDVALIILAGTPQEEGITPEAMTTGLLADGAADAVSMSDVETFQIDGRSAAISYGTTLEEGQTVGAILCAVELGEVAAVMLFYVPEAEVDQTIALARDIAAQMQFAPGESSQ